MSTATLALRRAIKERFPRLANLLRVALSPVNRVRFRLQQKPDRRILEEIIFPALLGDTSVKRILFVGCAWFTRGYSDYFADREFWTIDVDERVTRYAGERHIIGSITDVGSYFEAESLDVVVCNGVIGFGLDTEDQCDRAFGEIFRCLRPGGLLIVGWNDVRELTPFPLDGLPNFRAFEPHTLAPFPGSRYPTFSPLRHTFDFLRRPVAESGPKVGRECTR